MRIWVLALLAVMLAAPTVVAGGADEGGGAASTGATQATDVGALATGDGRVGIFATAAAYTEATGTAIDSFHEAPILAARVQAGELPPVEQRLPAEPLVLVPPEQIGTYGGTLTTVHLGRLDTAEDMTREFPLTYASDMQSIQPNLFKSWQVLDDGTRFIFDLRRGLKWSDGEPFTTADLVFYNQDIMFNQDLFPSGDAELKAGGELGVWRAVDDYTLEMTYAAPYGMIFESLSRWRPVPYAPRHYMTGYHADYVDAAELQRTVRASGFDSWVTLFIEQWKFPNNPDIPVIYGWKATNKFNEAVHVFQRNPYYWKIDPAGNQLPYVDEFHRVNVSDEETLILKTVAGDVDFMYSSKLGGSANFALLNQNAERSGYRLLQAAGVASHWGAVLFNYEHEDPVVRDLFRNRTFRIGLSHALNRDEINEILFRGSYNTMQVSVPTGPPHHGEDPKYHQYTAYDLDRANQLLDQAGLRWNDDRSQRLLPDGRPAQFTVIVRTGLQHPEMADMYRQYWDAVGIKTVVRPMNSNLLGEQMHAGNYELAVRNLNFGSNRPALTGTRSEVVPIGNNFYIHHSWGQWATSGGAKGVAPPAEYRGAVQRLAELQQAFFSEPTEAGRAAIADQIFQIHTDQQWAIGVLQRPWDLKAEWYMVFTNRVRNVPEPMGRDWYYAFPWVWHVTE